jgi:hypothetical protein
MTNPTCPLCKAPAYVGFTAVECPTYGCANYSAKEAIQSTAPQLLGGLRWNADTGQFIWDMVL